MNLNNPHKRYNPLADEWVLVSPHRSKRPWQGQQEQIAVPEKKPFSSNCYLCPGVQRASGKVNPDYRDTLVFTNDFSALLPDNTEKAEKDTPLFKARPETGVCRVICFSPRHDLTIALMQHDQVRKVVDTFQHEFKNLGEKKQINYVQIFENRGESMGCSNEHPHGQIWATGEIPTLPAKELKNQRQYLKANSRCMLCDYVNQERIRAERIIFENNSFVALVPYWAVWPFETMILPKHHLGSLLEFTEDDKNDLADALRRMGIRFDNLFKTSFPYSMGLHQTPTDGHDYPEHHFHIHYFPPLLRSATVKKFMVGFEMLAMPQRDLTAESCACRLKELAEIHYSEK